MSAVAPFDRNSDRQAQFFRCVSQNDLRAMKLLLKDGVDVNSVCGAIGGLRSVTALHVAAFKGHLAAVYLLLEYGARADAEDHFRGKPYDLVDCSISELRTKPDLLEILETLRAAELALEVRKIKDKIRAFQALDLSIGQNSRGRYPRLIDLGMDRPCSPGSADYV